MLVFQPSGSPTPPAQSFQFLGGFVGNCPISGQTITLDDSQSGYAPDAYAYFNCSPVSTYPGDTAPPNPASYKPTVNDASNNCSGSVSTAQFVSPAPATAPCATDNPHSPDNNGGGTATFGSQFSGRPNGTWSLYVYTNQTSEDDGATIGGWTLNITVQANAANTTTTLASNTTPFSNETFEGDSVTLTATVTSTSTVGEGTVNFTDGGTTIPGCGSVAVSSGQAQCTISGGFSTEGNHPLEAQYTGDANFGNSSGNLNLFIDHATTNPNPGQYCNTGTITINTFNAGPGTTPYPQHIFVPSTSSTVSDVNLYLPNITIGGITFFNFLLEDPNGNKFVPLAGTGGFGNASNVTLTLSDYGSSTVPNSDTGAAASGTYLPTDLNSGLSFASSPDGPPSGPYQLPQTQGGATFDTTFGGWNPSGMWSLYAYYASGDSTGSIGGYCLNITTSSAASTATTVSSTPNGEATTGTQVTFTATVKSGGNPVSSGTVTFKENGTVLSGPTTVNGSGQATFQTSSLSEGIHTVTANYSGVAGTYNVSSGTVTIEIDTATTNPSAGLYCNPGGINISGTNGNTNIPASPYPSRINVTNLAGTVNSVGVQLNNFSDGEADATAMLLQGPTMTNIVFWDGIGGDNSFSGLNLTIADSAGSGNPIPASPMTGQTYYPTADPDGLPNPAFPAPAPTAISFAPSIGAQTFTSAFQNINPLGYWSLYLYDRFGDDAVSINNWCLNVVNNPPVVTLGKVHNGTFTQGDTGDTYTITVANPSGPGSTAGTMTLTDTLPTGMTATAMSQTGGGTGSDWSCTTSPTLGCTRTTAMAPGESDTITLTVNVSYNTSTATNGAVNNVSLSGGGISGAPVTAQDTQTVQAGPGYALNLSVSPAGGGTASANPTNSAGLTANHYVPGATPTITATPTQTATIGYAFSSWSANNPGDLSSTTANPTTITMNSSTENVTANFVVAYQQASGGSFSVTETGILYSSLLANPGSPGSPGGGTTTFTVTNTSGSAISGPIQLVLTLPAGVTAANNTGTFEGNPYWTVTGGSLAASASAQVTVQLNYPSSTAVSTTPAVYTGSL